MKIKSVYLILLGASLLMFGCTKERLINESSSGITELSVTIPITRGLSVVDEGAIRTLRMIVFTTNNLGEETGAMIVNKLVHTSPDITSVAIKEIVPIGYLNIYFVANEAATWNLGSVSTIAQLKATVDTYTAANLPKSPFVMFGEYKRIAIDANGVTKQDGVAIEIQYIDRIAAKVTLNLDCTYATLQAHITIDKVSIMSMPDKLALYPSVTANYINSAETELSIGTNLETVGANIGFKTTGAGIDFYIPEHLITQTSKYTYIYITGFLTDTPSFKVAYRLPIGDGIETKTPIQMTTGTLSDLTITRNTHYTLNATIKSFGEFNGIEVVPTIAPWTPIDVPGDIIAPYLNVSTIATTFYDGAVSKVYFWSNQQNVKVDNVCERSSAVGIIGQAYDIAMESFTGLNFHYDYNQVTRQGEGWIQIVPKPVTDPTQGFELYSTRKITLNAGGFKRQITINNTGPVFAMSNIVKHSDGTLYFAEDNAALTANKTGANLTSAQGLMFRWGSLVGLEGVTAGACNASAVVFSPTEYTTTPTAWSATYPPYQAYNTTGFTNTRDEFTTAYPGVGYSAILGKGDICRYISDKGWVVGRWHIPTEKEVDQFRSSGKTGLSNINMLGLKYPAYDSQFATQTTTDINGKTQMTYGYYFGPGVRTHTSNTITNTITNVSIIPFPASGYRQATDGNLKYEDGTALALAGGYYWMSSVFGTYFNKAYAFNNFSVSMKEYDHGNAFSVRCVRDL